MTIELPEDKNLSTPSSIEPLNVDELEKARFEAVKLVGDFPRKIHMTQDFYLKLRIMRKVEIKKGVMSLRGMPVIIHNQPCEKEYWFEFDDRIKNAVYGWEYIGGELKRIRIVKVSLLDSSGARETQYLIEPE